MLETALLSGAIACWLHVIRANTGLIAQTWRKARWWERVAVVLLVGMPLLGPFDEMVAAFLVLRIVRRPDTLERTSTTSLRRDNG